MEQAVNQQFIKYLDDLKKRYGLSNAAVGRVIGVGKTKIADIRAGRSSANEQMIGSLAKAYPELSKGELAPKTKVDERMEMLERENARLLEENEKLRERVLRLADRILDEKR